MCWLKRQVKTLFSGWNWRFRKLVHFCANWIQIILFQFPKRVDLALSRVWKKQACLALIARGQAGHTEKAEIRSKATRTVLIPKGISDIFVSNLFSRSNGGCVSSTDESTFITIAELGGWHVRLPAGASSISQTCTFGFFSMFHSFPGTCWFFIAKGGYSACSSQNNCKFGHSLHIPANKFKRFTRARASNKHAWSHLTRALQLANRARYKLSFTGMRPSLINRGISKLLINYWSGYHQSLF